METVSVQEREFLPTYVTLRDDRVFGAPLKVAYQALVPNVVESTWKYALSSADSRAALPSSSVPVSIVVELGNNVRGPTGVTTTTSTQ
jgi:hypothetical protein